MLQGKKLCVTRFNLKLHVSSSSVVKSCAAVQSACRGQRWRVSFEPPGKYVNFQRLGRLQTDSKVWNTHFQTLKNTLAVSLCYVCFYSLVLNHGIMGRDLQGLERTLEDKSNPLKHPKHLYIYQRRERMCKVETIHKLPSLHQHQASTVNQTLII